MLKRIEKMNKKFVKPEIYEEFKKNSDLLISNVVKNKQSTVFDLFKLSRLRRISIILIIYW